MIEIVHFRNRYGKPMVGVFSPEINNMAASPAGVEYAQRYAAGLEKPFYPLPALHDAGLQAWPDILDHMWLLAFDWIASHD